MQYLIFLTSLCTCVASIATSFDYIVVGGGTAGLVVANRLSEASNATVLVIEAGASAQNNAVSTNAGEYGTYPGPVSSPVQNTLSIEAQTQASLLNWDYTTLPQKYARNETQHLPAGRGVGGSSLINGMVYSRASSAQINQWETAGNTGWNWPSLLSYYMKSEKFRAPGPNQYSQGIAYVPQFHGEGGNLATGFSVNQLQADVFPAYLNTSYQRLEIGFNSDMNGGYMRGFSGIPVTVNTTSGQDIRADAGHSYYYPYSSRKNLVLLTDTLAERILWKQGKDNEGRVVANAVEVSSSNGIITRYNASREVIVACGTYGSPPLLERSGVGNPRILNSYNIKTIVNLPSVGENLMDQASSNVTHRLKTDVQKQLGTFVSYFTIQDVFGADTQAFASSVNESLTNYTYSIMAQNSNSTNFDSLFKLLSLQYDLIFHQGVSIAEVLHHASGTVLTSEFWGTLPFARGFVHIRSNDTSMKPNIDTNYWMFPYDSTTNVRIAQFIRTKLLASTTNGTSIGMEISPGPVSVPMNATDSVYESWLKSIYHTGYHGIGTAIMLPQEAGGVVNNNTMVYGTSNVRVVDASIIPFQTNGHTQATVYALAEKASDIIKRTWNLG